MRVSINLSLGIGLLALLAWIFFKAEDASERLSPTVHVVSAPGQPAPAQTEPLQTLVSRRRVRAPHPVQRRARPAPQTQPAPAAGTPGPPATVRLKGKIWQHDGKPVARAEVELWSTDAGSHERILLEQAETDWEGNYAFDMEPPEEKAWIVVDALYYLKDQGPLFSIPSAIPPGGDLELSPLILHFGGSIDGEVLDGEGRKMPYAEVYLIARNPAEQGEPPMGRSDSKGTILYFGLQPGEYDCHVRAGGRLVVSIGEVKVQADAPTQTIHLQVGASSPTISQDQDPQQFRVYRSERILSGEPERFGSLREIQSYVDRMIASPWWGSEFQPVGSIQVVAGKEGDMARGGADSYWIGSESGRDSWASGRLELPRWAWDRVTALHEVAHVLSPGSGHGRRFARNFHSLVSRMLGDAAANELAQAYAAEGVQW